jgi:hypothetical protein
MFENNAEIIARYDAFEFGISWEAFGYLRESDIAALTSQLNIVAKSEVLYLWNLHPNNRAGKIYPIIIVSYSKFYIFPYMYNLFL